MKTGFGLAQIKSEGAKIKYDMANRNTLHVDKLGDFTLWLMAHGWQYQLPKGEYEVLRMTKREVQGPLMVFRRAAPGTHEHYTISGHSETWFKKWRRSINGERKARNPDPTAPMVETP